MKKMAKTVAIQRRNRVTETMTTKWQKQYMLDLCEERHYEYCHPLELPQTW